MNETVYRLPADTTLGAVRLRVSDLARAIEFYHDLLGLLVLRDDGGVAELSPARDAPALIVLEEHAGIRHRAERTPGLYHFALLFPDRLDLGRILLRLFERRVPFDGFADHGVSEAAYLRDPDGNGIELAADRPRDQWQHRDGGILMFTHALNVTGLLRLIDGDPWVGVPGSLRLGHVHLHVTDLLAVEHFYRDVLGFEITNRAYPGAVFLAAGGYHHHIAINTWAQGPRPRDAEVAGLVEFDLVLGGPLERASLLDHVAAHAQPEERTDGVRLRDPDGNGIRIP